ncbi:FMN-dependent NADH-azoreductase [Bordetella sp. N]|uniref:FMN-dependent NADH-azoreductase n=1 Tax=Bordetella sp. N TaxID=1746199 RepID=UPI0007105F4A|nr:NAD(P)H-dependent oxidoreductase [Bordetella sp. N]ALM83847.1 FMN-dependent NADH-azoreductase [Bordetella sp. N]
MSNILLITSSPRGAESQTSRLAADLAHKLNKQLAGSTLTIRDLYAQSLPHIDAAYVQGRMLPADGRDAGQSVAVAQAETLVAELQAADIVVIGSAMINFGPSTQLKAWVDHITWPGVTFKYADGKAEGLVTGKKVYLVTASGAVFTEGPFAAFDFHSNYLKHTLGFIGLTDIEQIRVEGLGYGPAVAEVAIANAEAVVESVLAKAA